MYVNKRKWSFKFQVGDKMLFKLTLHKGLIRKYEGPFEVLKKVGNMTCTLKLSNAYKIHLTFYVRFLNLFNEDATDVGYK